MNELSNPNDLEIDYSKITPINDVCETIMLSEELLKKYEIIIDESKIEQIYTYIYFIH